MDATQTTRGALLPVCIDDGGRAASGRTQRAGDCVTRAIAIAAGLPYDIVHEALSRGAVTQRKTRRSKSLKSADDGIYTTRAWFKQYMASLGFVWTPTMTIGSGCKVHLRAGEIPQRGRLVVSLSHHSCAVVDGVVHDLYDPSRDGTRCVYGFWTLLDRA